MTEPEGVVRRFFELLNAKEASAAAALLADDVEWRNTGFPTLRGRRVAGILSGMELRRVSFSADLHHVAADGPVVLTERTDYLGTGRLAADFWVCGTFRVEDGRIVLWDDKFSWGNVLAGVGRGAIRALRSPGRS